MAWFLNHYRCDRCHKVWIDEWSCMCDDDCPHCGCRHMTPFGSTDLGTLVAQDGDAFIVLRSSDDAEHGVNGGRIAEIATGAKFASAIAASENNLPPRGPS